jgi:hypothetical protein
VLAEFAAIAQRLMISQSIIGLEWLFAPVAMQLLQMLAIEMLPAFLSAKH